MPPGSPSPGGGPMKTPRPANCPRCGRPITDDIVKPWNASRACCSRCAKKEIRRFKKQKVKAGVHELENNALPQQLTALEEEAIADALQYLPLLPLDDVSDLTLPDQLPAFDTLQPAAPGWSPGTQPASSPISCTSTDSFEAFSPSASTSASSLHSSPPLGGLHFSAGHHQYPPVQQPPQYQPAQQQQPPQYQPVQQQPPQSQPVQLDPQSQPPQQPEQAQQHHHQQPGTGRLLHEEIAALSHQLAAVGVAIQSNLFLQHISNSDHTKGPVELLRNVFDVLHDPTVVVSSDRVGSSPTQAVVDPAQAALGFRRGHVRSDVRSSPENVTRSDSEVSRVRSCASHTTDTTDPAQAQPGIRRGNIRSDIRSSPENVNRTRSCDVFPQAGQGAQAAAAEDVQSNDSDDDDEGDFDFKATQAQVAAALASRFAAFLNDSKTTPHDRVFTSADVAPVDVRHCSEVTKHAVVSQEFSPEQRGLIVTMRCRGKYKMKKAALDIIFGISFIRETGIFRIKEVLKFVPLGKFSAAWQADLTHPDGSYVRRGQIIHKVWQVKNTGDTDWDGRVKLREYDEKTVCAVMDVVVPPGEVTQVAVDAKIPADASSSEPFEKQYRLWNGEKEFGDLLCISLNITADN